MSKQKVHVYRAAALLVALAMVIALIPGLALAQDGPGGPVMLDAQLDVRTVVEGLNTPTTMGFLNENEFLVLEKNTGMVQHVMNGTVVGTALDLGVNFASERGLLGIAIDPDFDNNGYVYLFWTCRSTAPVDSPYFPVEIECADEPTLGEDTDDTLAVPLLGNRVDRFIWDGSSLTWDLNLVKLRAFQNDSAPIPRGQGDEDQPVLGNHDGGVITFGQDGKLYIITGDTGRRSGFQNLPFGPTTPLTSSGDAVGASFAQRNLFNERPMADDQFGGPLPDDAHFTGVILRLNGDGTIPEDNPFYDVGAAFGGEIGENIQMTFAYGVRNSFGMDVDPVSGDVWFTENGEDAFDELNRAFPGHNSGWIQIMGPLERLSEYKEIETTSLHNEAFPNLQQLRWPPENIADSADEARRRLTALPGSQFSDPEYAWAYVIAPAALGFVKSEALGLEFAGDMFMGLSVPIPLDGPLFHFDLTPNRRQIQTNVPGTTDRVADNDTFNSLKESEPFLIGTGFGIVTDIKTGPNGSLYVVSLSNGAVYEIFRGEDTGAGVLTTIMTGAAEVPGPGDPDGYGSARVLLDPSSGEVCYALTAQNIILPAAAAHIHVGTTDVAGAIVIPLEPPDETGSSAACTTADPALVADILANPAGYYVNVHDPDFPAGAIRGQLMP